uniref:Uncharacterized protein n=1 Tax=Solanum lycopersicum TaxID=4081 RepID=K4BWG4_SOLLC
MDKNLCKKLTYKESEDEGLVRRLAAPLHLPLMKAIFGASSSSSYEGDWRLPLHLPTMKAIDGACLFIFFQ